MESFHAKNFEATSVHSDLRELAADLHRLWDFPMCIDAMDGKHIMVQAPPKRRI